MMITTRGAAAMTSRAKRLAISSLRSPLTPQFTTSQSGCASISQYEYWLCTSPLPAGGASSGLRQPGVPAVVELPSTTIRMVWLLDQQSRRRSAFQLKLLRDFFHLPHRAQDVEAEDFLQVVLFVSPAKQFSGQHGIRRDVLHALHDRRNPVEVAAETDVIDSGDLPDVIDVIGDVGH